MTVFTRSNLAESVKTEVARSESVRKPSVLSEVLRAFLPLFQAKVVIIALKTTGLFGFKFTECGHPLTLWRRNFLLNFSTPCI